MEDGILDNLPNIEGYVLDDSVVVQGTLVSHFTHVRLGNIGQMLGLEVHGVPFTIELPLTSPVGQDPEDLRVVRPLIEPIKRLGWNWVKIVELVDRLRTEVYHHSTHPDLFDDIGGKVGVEFSYHTRRSCTRWLALRPPSLIRNGLAKEVIGVVEALFFYEGPIFTNGTKSIGDTLIDKLCEAEIRGRVLTGPTPFSGQLLPLTRHMCRGV